LLKERKKTIGQRVQSEGGGGINRVKYKRKKTWTKTREKEGEKKERT